MESEWPGKTLSIGDARLAVVISVPRCVMTTLSQGDLPADREVLQTITQHNSLDVGFGVFPCLGVYADGGVGGRDRDRRSGDDRLTRRPHAIGRSVATRGRAQ